jgi:hypothetical protein
MERKSLKIKSPCLGELSILELAKFAIVIGSIWLAFSVFYAQHKDIPNRVAKLETEQTSIKVDVKGIKTKVDLIYDIVSK